MYKYKSTISRDLNIKILPTINNIYQAAPLYFMIPKPSFDEIKEKTAEFILKNTENKSKKG